MPGSETQEIWSAVLESNRAWLAGRPEQVARLFHEDVVATFPGMQQRLVGREAMVQSYIEYCRSATTHAFEELDHTVDVFGDTAVVTYRFSVRYEAHGAVHDELGQEILVFMRRDGRWGVVWRSQVPLDR